MDVPLHGQSVLKPLRPRKALALSLFALTAYFLTGCVFPVYSLDYKSKLAVAQKDCKGNEVVGIWQAKVKGTGTMARQTLLFRPNGTGVMRQNVYVPLEIQTEWRYAGGGVWNGRGHEPAFTGYANMPHILTIHYANGELLMEDRQKMISSTEDQCAVYERAP